MMKQVEGCIFDLDNVLIDSENSAVLPGVKRFLINLRVSGMKLAVTSEKYDAKNILELLKIQDFFDVILSNDHLNSNAEPLLRETAEELCISPENCVVFNNESNTLIEAKKLNMSAIAVGKNCVCSAADKVIPSLSNVNSSILNFNN